MGWPPDKPGLSFGGKGTWYPRSARPNGLCGLPDSGFDSNKETVRLRKDPERFVWDCIIPINLHSFFLKEPVKIGWGSSVLSFFKFEHMQIWANVLNFVPFLSFFITELSICS